MKEASEMASAAVAQLTAALSDAQYFEAGMMRPDDIRRLLDSKTVAHKIDGLKRVIALISLGKDASGYFPDVVKNVASGSLDVRKLVYLYLVHYAEQEPETALLAINTFQKDLSDPSQLIRALALRVLSSIRVRLVQHIVLLAVGRATADASPYVRKTAALAIAKLWSAMDEEERADPALGGALAEPLATLLNDRAMSVLGAAVAAHQEVFPTSWAMLHAPFRRLCGALIDLDEWAQVVVLTALTRYARANLCPEDADVALLRRCSAPLLRCKNEAVVLAALSLLVHTTAEFSAAQPASNVDLPPSFGLALARLISSSMAATQVAALAAARAIAEAAPQLLLPHVLEFYVFAGDCDAVALRKLDVLSVLLKWTTTSGATTVGGVAVEHSVLLEIVDELKEYTGHPSAAVAASAANALGIVALYQDSPENGEAESSYLVTGQHSNSSAKAARLRCLRVLIDLVCEGGDSPIVAEAMFMLRRVIQRDPAAHVRTLHRLASLLCANRVRSLEALASICWLVGEHLLRDVSSGPLLTCDAVRVLTQRFVNGDLDVGVKLQLLLLASKLWCRLEEPEVHADSVSADDRGRAKGIVEHVFKLARYDKDFDVRERALLLAWVSGVSRAFENSENARSDSTADVSLREHVRAAMLNAKPCDSESRSIIESDERTDVSSLEMPLGSMAHAVALALQGARNLEPWRSTSIGGAEREASATAAPPSLQYATRSGFSSSDVSMSASGTEHGLTKMSGFSSLSMPALASTGLSTASTSRVPDVANFYVDGDDDADESDESSEAGSVENEPAAAVVLFNAAEEQASAAESSRESVSALRPNQELSTNEANSSDDLLRGMNMGAARAEHSTQGPENWLAELQIGTAENAAHALAAAAKSADELEWNVALRPWSPGANGVLVEFAFPFVNAPGGPQWTRIYIRVTNTSSLPIHSLQVSAARAADNAAAAHRAIRTVAIERCDEALAVDARAMVVIDARDMEVGGASANAALSWKTVESQGEASSVVVEIKGGLLDLLKPAHALSAEAFDSAVAELGGMFVHRRRATVALEAGISADLPTVRSKLASVILAVAKRLHPVRGGSSLVFDSPSESLRFFGLLPSPSLAPFYLRISNLAVDHPRSPSPSQSPASVSAEASIHCEEVLLASALLNLILDRIQRPH